MVIGTRCIQENDRQLPPGTFVVRPARGGLVHRAGPLEITGAGPPRGSLHSHGGQKWRPQRSTHPHCLWIVGKLLAAVEANDVWFALSDAMLPDRRHRPAQAAVAAMQKPIEDSPDHDGLTRQGPV